MLLIIICRNFSEKKFFNFKWTRLTKMILSLRVFHLYISPFLILKTVMYPSSEIRLVPSQATKINLFVRIIKVFILMLLTISVKSTIMDFWRTVITPLTSFNACNHLTLSWRRFLSSRNQSIDLFYMTGISVMKELNVSQLISR